MRPVVVAAAVAVGRRWIEDEAGKKETFLGSTQGDSAAAQKRKPLALA